jgi:hypothetical protein
MSRGDVSCLEPTGIAMLPSVTALVRQHTSNWIGSDLRQDFALDNPFILKALPLTVRHAIALAEALGERYLWTDSLCITHEDLSTLPGQLEQMAAIYSSALFTIVAHDGDGTKGIMGLPGISEPRKTNQQVFDFGSEKLIARGVDYSAWTEKSAYHQRGWTYQEFLMSPRKLMFLEGEAHWMCQCCEWHEDLARDLEINKSPIPRPHLMVAGFPDIAPLKDLLNDYNERNLTYDEDALPAIAGLLSVLSRTFTGGFLYGLPEMMFDTALGWSTASESELTKRVPSKPVRHDQDIPSWSWLSWQGRFDWEGPGEWGVRGSWRTFKDGLIWFKETSPITEWYASSALEGQPRRKIDSAWYRQREHAKDHRQPLTDGWSRHEATIKTGLSNGQVRLFPDGCESYVYEHRDAPVTEGKQYFYYPIRVPLVNPSTPFFNPAQTRYLFCKTWKSSVWACWKDYDYSRGNRRLCLHMSMNRPSIGSMQLHNREQSDRWGPWRSTSGKYKGKPTVRLVEVVAINRGVLLAPRDKEAVERGGLPVSREEYVTVLWVKWEGIVALRQASGRIERKAWESLDLEEIDLVLG